MIGAPLRLVAWFVILTTLLSACAPAIRFDEAATDRPIQTSSAPPAARDDVPTPHRAPSPTPTSVPTPAPLPQAFALNLYQEGDFVRQCVAASIQIMHNLIVAVQPRSSPPARSSRPKFSFRRFQEKPKACPPIL
jgi:hypothetical protein